MLVYFDDGKDFNKELKDLISGLGKYVAPLVVLPTEKDVRTATKEYEGGDYDHVTFISYDYWYSKKWLADGDYDHIDFFRADQFFINRSFGVKTGVVTIRRTMKKKEKEEQSC